MANGVVLFLMLGLVSTVVVFIILIILSLTGVIFAVKSKSTTPAPTQTRNVTDGTGSENVPSGNPPPTQTRDTSSLSNDVNPCTAGDYNYDQNWSQCDQCCGNGTQTRVGTLKTGTAASRNCNATDVATQRCNPQPCPTNVWDTSKCLSNKTATQIFSPLYNVAYNCADTTTTRNCRQGETDAEWRKKPATLFQSAKTPCPTGYSQTSTEFSPPKCNIRLGPPFCTLKQTCTRSSTAPT
jgi:hypothetical protein